MKIGPRSPLRHPFTADQPSNPYIFILHSSLVICCQRINKIQCWCRCSIAASLSGSHRCQERETMAPPLRSAALMHPSTHTHTSTSPHLLSIWHLNLHSERFSFSMSAHALHVFISCLLQMSHFQAGVIFSAREKWPSRGTLTSKWNKLSGCHSSCLLVFELIIKCVSLLLPKSSPFTSQLFFFLTIFYLFIYF